MRLLCSLLLLLALPALAQAPAQPQPRPAPKASAPPVQNLTFEDDLIPGTVQSPLGTLVVVPERPTFRAFHLVRDHFNDKLIASVDEM